MIDPNQGPAAMGGAPGASPGGPPQGGPDPAMLMALMAGAKHKGGKRMRSRTAARKGRSKTKAHKGRRRKR